MVKALVKKRPRSTRTYHRNARAIHNGLDLHQRLDNIRDSIGELGDTISGKAAKIVAKSIRKARSQSKRVGRYVTKKPYRTVGFALVTAVILSFLIRNRD